MKAERPTPRRYFQPRERRRRGWIFSNVDRLISIEADGPFAAGLLREYTSPVGAAAVAAVGGRTTEFTVDGDLTRVDPPAGLPIVRLLRPPAHREQFGVLETDYTNASGLVATAQSGSASARQIAPASRGLAEVRQGGFAGARTDELGIKAEVLFNPFGQALAKVSPRGAVQLIQRNPADEITQIKDAVGNVTDIERNGAGLLTQIAKPGGGIRTMIYTGTFDEAAVWIDERGFRTSATYDLTGHLTTLKDLNGAVTSDLWDQGLLMTDPLGRVLTTMYDEHRRTV